MTPATLQERPEEARAMSYDDEMRRKISVKLAGGTRLAPSEWRRDVDAVCDALDPLTLKTEDGRLAEMERVGFDPGGCPLYREKWEAPDA